MGTSDGDVVGTCVTSTGIGSKDTGAGAGEAVGAGGVGVGDGETRGLATSTRPEVVGDCVAGTTDRKSVPVTPGTRLARFPVSNTSCNTRDISFWISLSVFPVA